MYQTQYSTNPTISAHLMALCQKILFAVQVMQRLPPFIQVLHQTAIWFRLWSNKPEEENAVMIYILGF